MPAPRTIVTELGTALGMLGHATIDEALAARPPAMVSVAPENWKHLEELRGGGAFDDEFEAAFTNGRAFLGARDGLRHRLPLTIEWKGSQRAPGDEVAPVDLRVDHVYLVSCKYLSHILFNASPAHLFGELLAGRHGRRSGDWFDTVAPTEHQTLYRAVRPAGPFGLPDRAADLRPDQRRALAAALAAGWPEGADPAYAALAAAVSVASARRWQAALDRAGDQEAMLWRLLRMGSAPYFVLGATARHPLRLRIATPWDWRRRFRLRRVSVAAQPGGQPRVGWRAAVDDVTTGRRHDVVGHVEIRWSHGRFGGTPEAKVYLDTPHAEVPGYFPLDPGPAGGASGGDPAGEPVDPGRGGADGAPL